MRVHCVSIECGILCVQVKYMLILDVINVLGVDNTLHLFYQTVSIQENGGELTADGTRRLAAQCVAPL